MTYEEFKKELYRNVCNQMTNADKKIRLLEKGTSCTKADDLKIVKCINLHCRGREETVIHEDIIYAGWGSENMLRMLYWPVRPLYERLKKEGWQSVLPEIVAKLQETETKEKNTGNEKENYAQSSKRFIVRPVNFRQNIGELENCIYWRFGDIALVLYLLIFDDGEEFMTMKVNRGMTEHWKLSDELILTNALLNTCEKMPPRLYPGDDIRLQYDTSEGIFMKEEGNTVKINMDDETDGLRGYRITTTRGLNGAIAFFYPGVRERIAELLGGDYYLGFTSIHEAVVHPVQYKILGEMKAALYHTNIVFDGKEKLTNRTYRYLSIRKELIEV